MRRPLLSILSGLMTGVLVLGVAWATAGLVPVNDSTAPVERSLEKRSKRLHRQNKARVSTQEVSVDGTRLPEGVFLVGSHNESIAPVPVSEGGQWNAHGNGYDCGPIGYEYLPNADPSCLRTFDRVWATGVDEASDLGVHARAIAIGNGEDTLAFVVLDTVSWF